MEEVIKEEPKKVKATVKAEEHKEEKPVEAVASTEVVSEEKDAPKEDEVFKIRQPELGAKINVIGQIDLAALNQSTALRRNRRKRNVVNVKKKRKSARIKRN